LSRALRVARSLIGNTARLAADPRVEGRRRGSAIRALPGGKPWLAQVWEDVGDLITLRVVVDDGAMVVRSSG